jgi:hypothetical protein
MKNIAKLNELMFDPQIRLHWLQYLANKRGDFKTAFCFKNKDGEVCFSKHHTVIHCQETENYTHLMKASHRQIFEEEIVLDFDRKDFKNSNALILKAVYGCRDNLLKRKFGFKIFQTGSTGYHIHIPFDKSSYTLKRLERLRKVMVAKYNCDSAKAYASNLIALEFAPHWKTGNQKRLLFDNTTEDIEYELSR